ncbi:CdaR family transcriptional regulator [Blautia obeum]|uniref:CdaR family transcriptional regulator n=1 Tax=Blautia obeum TaxID=40520 RepID=UPI003D0337D8
MNIISKKTAQQIVDTVKDVCGYNINFINENGMILASTDASRIGTYHEGGKQVIKTGIPLEVYEDNSLSGTQKGVNIPVSHNGVLTAVIGISGEPDQVRTYAYLAERITRLLIREQEVNAASRTLTEKKAYLIQTLVDGNLENPDYIHDLLKEFHINTKTSKRVILIRVYSHDEHLNISMAEAKIHRFFNQIPDSVFCFQFPNEFIGIIDDASFETHRNKLETFASSNQGITLGVGRPDTLYQLDASLNTAQIAIESLKGTDSSFALFDDLTLEIILGQFDPASKKEFLKKTISQLSPEDISLLQVYFEESQSLSHTCEKLFLHKNTLQYKLDRIYRISGFNPRNFKDAVILYLATKLYKCYE